MLCSGRIMGGMIPNQVAVESDTIVCEICGNPMELNKNNSKKNIYGNGVFIESDLYCLNCQKCRCCLQDMFYDQKNDEYYCPVCD